MTTEALWRVEAIVGLGWPLCTGRERKVRRFSREKDAAAWIATILASPSHHRLLSVECGRIEYVTSDGVLALPDVACGGCGTNLGAPDAPTYEPVCPHCGSRARFLDRSNHGE